MYNRNYRGVEQLAGMGELMHELGRAEVFELMLILAEGPVNCTDLCDRMQIDHATVCHRLRILRQLGLATYERHKKEHHYHLTEAIECVRCAGGYEFRLQLDGLGELIVRSSPHESTLSSSQTNGTR